MGLEERRQTIKAQRELLISELETVYMAAFERIGQLGLGDFRKQPTLPFNGYGEQVASLYAGMDLRRFY